MYARSRGKKMLRDIRKDGPLPPQSMPFSGAAEHLFRCLEAYFLVLRGIIPVEWKRDNYITARILKLYFDAILHLIRKFFVSF